MYAIFLAMAVSADPGGFAWGANHQQLAWGVVHQHEEKDPDPSADEIYFAARKRAIAQNKPMIVFVGEPARDVPGYVVVSHPGAPLFTGSGLLYSYPKNGTMWVGKPEDERQVTPIQATPFDVSRFSRKLPSALTEGKQTRLVSLWPKDVELPKDLTVYEPTRLSQRLTITNDRDQNLLYDKDQDDHFSNAPTSFNPNRQFPWHVPGGLENSRGWESLIAVSMPSQPYVYLDRVEAGARHPLPKVRWTFPEGTVFADMLVNDGKVFELRTRTKRDGKWVSSKAFEDKAARPAGYHGLTKSCIECHEQAGSQLQYGIGLRGDDGAFSWSAFDHHDAGK